MTACWQRTWWRWHCVGAPQSMFVTHVTSTTQESMCSCDMRHWMRQTIAIHHRPNYLGWVMCIVLNASTTSSFHFWNLVVECLSLLIAVIDPQWGGRYPHHTRSRRFFSDVLVMFVLCVEKLRSGLKSSNFLILDVGKQSLTPTSYHHLIVWWFLMHSQGLWAASQGTAWSRPIAWL